MGTIIKRKRKDGSAAWLAQIAVRRAGKTVWRENRTFECPSSNKMEHQSGLSIGGSGSFV